MNNGRYSLGIDTSNYKTSVAVTDEKNNIIFSKSEFLEVEHGARGLRQSVAFFKHVNVLPSFIDDALSAVNPDEIGCIAVSEAPRRLAGSYMPVFAAGVDAARLISSSLQIPLFKFSHQEGHVSAVLHSFPDERLDGKILFFHLSGGTTEALLTEIEDSHYNLQIIGGTRDISVGQLLDRTGVALGYDFPAGRYLDNLSCDRGYDGSRLLSKIKVTDGWFNLSGTEFQVMKSIADSGDEVVPELLERISILLCDAACMLADKFAIDRVYMAGGVSTSQYFRMRSRALNAHERFEMRFGLPELSGDNAVGIALLGGRALCEKGNR